MTEHKSKIFLSYAREDLAFARELASGLTRVGRFDVLFDQTGIAHGEDWKGRLGRMIATCDTMVFVISPDSLGSNVCAWEVEEADRLSKRIIPALWRDADFAKAPKALARLNAVPFHQERAVTGLQDLIDALDADLDWLREHTRLLERAQEWERAGRSAEYLMRGAALAQARLWLAARPASAPDPLPLHLAFLGASETEEARLLNVERQRANQAQRFARVIAVVAAIAMGVAAYAIWQRGEAQRAQGAAETARGEAVRAESVALAGLADAVTENGDAVTGALLALEALPEGEDDRPATIPAMRSLYSALDARREIFLMESLDPINAFGLNASGRLAYVVSGETLFLIDTRARAVRAEWTAPETPKSDEPSRRPRRGRAVAVADLTEDEVTLVLRRRTAQIRDAETLALKQSFALDGDFHRSGGGGGSLRLILYRKGGYVVQRLDGTRLGPPFAADERSYAFLTPDQTRLVVFEVGRLSIVDVATGEAEARLTISNRFNQLIDEDEIFVSDVDVVFYDGEGLGVVGFGQAAQVRRSRVPRGSYNPTSIVGAPEGDWFVITSMEGDSLLTRRDPGQRTDQQLLRGHRNIIWRGAVGGGGDVFVSGSTDGAVIAWDVETASEIATLSSAMGPIGDVRIARDGAVIAAISEDWGLATLWDLSETLAAEAPSHDNTGLNGTLIDTKGGRMLRTGEDHAIEVVTADGAVAETFEGHHQHPSMASFSRSGAVVASRSQNEVIAWRVADQKVLLRLEGAKGRTSHVAVAPDDQRVLVIDQDRLKIYDLGAGSESPSVDIAIRSDIWPFQTAFSQDGLRFVSPLERTELALRDSLSGDVLRAYRAGGEIKGPVALSPDDSHVAAVNWEEHVAYLWDSQTGALRHTLEGHLNAIWSIGFSPDSNLFFTASEDKTVLIWDVATGDMVRRITPGEGYGIEQTRFSEDGAEILVGAIDGSIKTFPMFPDAPSLIAFARETLPRCLSKAQRRRFDLGEERAVAACQEANKWPFTSTSLFREGERRLAASEDAAAQEAFDRAARADPSLRRRADEAVLDTYLLRGFQAANGGDFESALAWNDKARGHAQQALPDEEAQVDRARGSLFVERARRHLRDSMPTEALKDLETAATLRELHLRGLQARAEAHLALDAPRKALEDLDALAAKRDGPAQKTLPLLLRARAHEALGDRDAAIESYRALLDLPLGGFGEADKAAARERLSALGAAASEEDPATE